MFNAHCVSPLLSDIAKAMPAGRRECLDPVLLNQRRGREKNNCREVVVE